MRRAGYPLALVAAMLAAPPQAGAQISDIVPMISSFERDPVVITGGHDTDPRDRGRPVILVAVALGVRPEVFRDAFSHVHPAPAGQAPEPAQVQANKRALLARLGPYGVTNDRLDEVSNYYRYRRETGELWRHKEASAEVGVRSGQAFASLVIDRGAGYSSPPVLTVTGHPEIHLVAVLHFDTDLSKNGSIADIKIVP